MPRHLYEPLGARDGGENGIENSKEGDSIPPGGRYQQDAGHFFKGALTVLVPWLLAFVFAASTLYFATRTNLQVAGDINGIAPGFKQHLVTFQPNKSFVANLTGPGFKDSTRHVWLDMVPKGLGFLGIPNPEQYPALPPPYHRHNRTVYTTSITHQLHCLYMIMTSYNDIAVNGYTPPSDTELDPHWHIAHCFDYIRQAIICAGDVALEGKETTFPSGVTGTDGWGVQHVCKDYSKVYAWLEDMAVDNRTRI